MIDTGIFYPFIFIIVAMVISMIMLRKMSRDLDKKLTLQKTLSLYGGRDPRLCKVFHEGYCKAIEEMSDTVEELKKEASLYEAAISSASRNDEKPAEMNG